MSVHISAKNNEIAETILLPGDPLRAKFIAENFLEDVVQYTAVRNILGFTGTYKGKRISVQGTGMGIPSISIYVNELFQEYGVKRAIRIGTAGSINKNVQIKNSFLNLATRRRIALFCTISWNKKVTRMIFLKNPGFFLPVIKSPRFFPADLFFQSVTAKQELWRSAEGLCRA